MKNAFPIVKRRKAVKLGSSLYVAIPHQFVERHGIKRGDLIAVTMSEELLKVVPFQDRTGDREGGN